MQDLFFSRCHEIPNGCKLHGFSPCIHFPLCYTTKPFLASFMLKIYSTTEWPSAGLVRWGEIGHNKPFLVLSLTCLAQINLAKDVSACLGGHSAGWHGVSSVCPLYSSGCRAQWSAGWGLFSTQLESPFWWGVCTEPVWLLPYCSQGRFWANWNPSVGEVATSFEQWLPFSLGKGSWGQLLLCFWSCWTVACLL